MKRISIIGSMAVGCALLLSLNACNGTSTVDKQTQKIADEAVASNEEKDLTGTFTGKENHLKEK